jgi:uncharacterized phage infection (PIP) family protein YhgE
MHGRRGRVIVVSAALAVVGLACGDDSTSSTTTTTTTPPPTTNPGPVGSASAELCAARDELTSSISDLSNVDVVKNGTSAITSALDKIKQNLSEVRSAAGSDVQPQVEAFQRAVDQLQAAVSGSGAGRVAATVSGVRDVASTGATLLRSLGNLQCP